MAKTENRFVRIEDWKGNVYYPQSDSTSSTAGSVSDSSSASSEHTPIGTYTDGEKVADSTSNGGNAIVVSSGSERQALFCTSLSNLPFGNISIGIRIKSSIGTGTVNLLEVNTYFVDASGETPVETMLDSTSINGNTIGIANEYVNLGTVTNYKGVATGSTFLKIEIIVLPDTGATIYFDQLSAAMEMKAISSNAVYVEDRTVVVG